MDPIPARRHFLDTSECSNGFAPLVGGLGFMEKRGDGVPIILAESTELSGREPEYRLIDESELLLTIWAAMGPGPQAALSL